MHIVGQYPITNNCTIVFVGSSDTNAIAGNQSVNNSVLPALRNMDSSSSVCATWNDWLQTLPSRTVGKSARATSRVRDITSAGDSHVRLPTFDNPYLKTNYCRDDHPRSLTIKQMYSPIFVL